MKKTTLAMIIMGFLMMLISSCTKENGPQVGISTDPYGGIIVQLNWGGSGYYYPNYPNGYPSSVSSFIGYITSKPSDPTRITICNKYGTPICIASCISAQWQSANQFFALAQSLNYPPYIAVKILVQKNTMTYAGDEFFVAGY